MFMPEQAMQAIFDFVRAGLRTKQWIDSARGVESLGFRGEDSMRLAVLSVTISLALGCSVALAQQSPDAAGDKPVGDTIGHPPPLPGPPPIPEPPAKTPPPPTASPPQASAPAPKGYTGAYAPAGTPPTPYSTGPLPQPSEGPGLNKVAPDGVSTRTVKAVPCGTVARETDGTTTCVGIPDQASRNQSPGRRRR
jgi:hypothetical protein